MDANGQLGLVWTRKKLSLGHRGEQKCNHGVITLIDQLAKISVLASAFLLSIDVLANCRAGNNFIKKHNLIHHINYQHLFQCF